MATKRINVCVYCDKEFVRKTLIKSGINVGKHTYSKVKYCDEHKHLSFGRSASTRIKKQTNNALSEWRRNGGNPWNKGLKSEWKRNFPKCIDCQKILGSYSKRCKPCSGRLRRGNNNPNWNGGVTKKDRLERIKFRKTIQKQVFERDDYTCQMCGARGVALQVDHIQSWKDYVELRFSMDNCRTLCMDCHYFVTFGRKKPIKVKTWGHNYSYVLKGVRKI